MTRHTLPQQQHAGPSAQPQCVGGTIAHQALLPTRTSLRRLSSPKSPPPASSSRSRISRKRLFSSRSLRISLFCAVKRRRVRDRATPAASAAAHVLSPLQWTVRATHLAQFPSVEVRVPPIPRLPSCLHASRAKATRCGQAPSRCQQCPLYLSLCIPAHSPALTPTSLQHSHPALPAAH